jgi:hypothetical protein
MTTLLRASRAIVVAALFVLTTSAASAQDRTAAPAGPASDAMRLGVLGGFEFEDETGFGLRGDLELMPLAKVGEGTLKLLGSASWTYFSEDEGGIEATSNVFRLIPGVRLDVPLQDRLGVYGDAGLGLYHARVNVEADFGFGTIDEDDSETSFLFRFAGGGYYEVNESVRVVAELGLLPHLGDFDITPFTLFGGVSFAF